MTDRLLHNLALARGPLRVDTALREADNWWEQAVAAGALCVRVRGGELDVTGHALAWHPAAESDRDRTVLLGVQDEPRLAVFAEPRTPMNLRLMGAQLNDEDAAWATTAVALSNWHYRHRHCARCGADTVVSAAGWSRTCTADKSVWFPRTDPAVIVLCRDDRERVLLGRRADWPETWFSTLAGFVEAGESAEHAVLREIREEVGMQLDPERLLYRGSQPWPFPASLMLGYHAWSLSGSKVEPDGTEIVETRWLSRTEIASACEQGTVRIPPPVSIARRLIEDWYGSTLPGEWSRP